MEPQSTYAQTTSVFSIQYTTHILTRAVEPGIPVLFRLSLMPGLPVQTALLNWWGTGMATIHRRALNLVHTEKSVKARLRKGVHERIPVEHIKLVVLGCWRRV